MISKHIKQFTIHQPINNA